jgi:hypothetical protein
MAAPTATALDRATLAAQGYDWLLESAFLYQLDAAGQDRILAELSWRSWPRGALLVTTGERPDGMELIVEGSADVFQPGTGRNVYDFQHGDRIAKAGQRQAEQMLPDILAAWQHGRTGLAAGRWRRESRDDGVIFRLASGPLHPYHAASAAVRGSAICRAREVTRGRLASVHASDLGVGAIGVGDSVRGQPRADTGQRRRLHLLARST